MNDVTPVLLMTRVQFHTMSSSASTVMHKTIYTHLRSVDIATRRGNKAIPPALLFLQDQYLFFTLSLCISINRSNNVRLVKKNCPKTYTASENILNAKPNFF